jgi:hypothetical protein
MTENNQLLQDTIHHLATSPEARERFNSISASKLKEDISLFNKSVKDSDTIYYKLFNIHKIYDLDFRGFDLSDRLYFIQTALSNTTDGKPVCDFLAIQHYTEFLNETLYKTFTTALFNGKDFETALEEANEVYLKNIKK